MPSRYWSKRYKATRGSESSSSRGTGGSGGNPFGDTFSFGPQTPSPGVPQIFVNNDDPTDSPLRVMPLELGGISNFSAPKRPQLGIVISPAEDDRDTRSPGGASPGGSSPGHSVPDTPQRLSPAGSPRHSPVSESPPAGVATGRAGSAQSALEDALDSSEWGRQIRSYVARSPSSAGLRNRSTSNAAVRERSRSPTSPSGFRLP